MTPYNISHIRKYITVMGPVVRPRRGNTIIRRQVRGDVSDSSRFGVDRTRVGGLGVALVGLAGLAAFPEVYVQNRVMNAVRAAGFAAWFWAITGSMLVVWGLSTVGTGRWRSLTPRWAAVAPVLVFAAHAAVALRMNAWSGGERDTLTLSLEFVTWTLFWEQLRGSVGVAAALFGVAAVASFRGQRDWVLGSFALVALLGVALGYVSGSISGQFFVLVTRSALMGLGAAYVGYYAAAPLDSGDGRDATAARDGESIVG